MHFVFRPTRHDDKEFYLRCFSNNEFQAMMYFNSPLKLSFLDEYINQTHRDLKYICIYKTNATSSDFKIIGFVHLYYKGDDTFAYVGRMPPT